MEREGLVSAYRISEETTPKEGVASIPKPKMSSSSSSEEGQVDPERRLRVFQMKVIKRLQPDDVDSNSESSEDIETVCVKKQKLGDDAHQKTPQDDQRREREALDVQKRHQEFMEAQTKRAEQFTKRKRTLETVSSKLSVTDCHSESSHSCRPGMEGKGPRSRLVPQSVKNYRKRLKKKKNRSKQNE